MTSKKRPLKSSNVFGQYKPDPHQLISLKHAEENPRVLDFSDAGCVSADTEYLTPTGWKRIDEYTPGDMVAQFLPDSREIEFVAPTAYIKRPCGQMVAINPVRGMSQRLSLEHRVLFYRPDGTHGVCSAAEFMEDAHRHGTSHVVRKFCSTFSVRSGASIGLSDAQIRLMVAVIADGSFPKATNRCVIRIKKARKIQRLQELLDAAEVPHKVHCCGGADPEFRVFSFTAPRREKEFSAFWWDASQRQLEVIASELPHWDGSSDTRPSAGTRFSTLVEATADFAQYAFAASKRPASKVAILRDRSSEGRGKMVEYAVHARASDTLIGPGRKESIYLAPNHEGFKYCFEVPSTFLLLRHNGHIFATGNTGKTPVTLWAYAQYRQRGGTKKMLVICPRTLMTNVWANSVRKFTPQFSCVVAKATNREAAFKQDVDIYITNIDAVTWLGKQRKAFFDRFDWMVVDESSAYKHHTSQRSKAAAKIRKHFDYRRLMSGTPRSRSITDVWHQAFLVDDGQRLGNSFYSFRNSVADPKQVGANKQAIQWTDREGAEEAVFGLLADIVVRHDFDEVVKIPERRTYSVAFEMPPKLQKAYAQMQRQQFLLYQEKQKHGTVTAVHAAVVRQKLLQIASGAVYGDRVDATKDRPAVTLDTSRYEFVMDLAVEAPYTLVLFLWRHQRDALAAEAEKRGLNFVVVDGDSSDLVRESIETDYQAGKYDVVIAHPQTVAHGLTFTLGTTTIWSSPTDNSEWWVQANRRQARRGQDKETRVITVVAPGTADEMAYDNCTGKATREANFLDLFTMNTRGDFDV